MLVIQRKKGEGVKVGDEIFVRVLQISRNRVKLGIEAPRDLSIARDEVAEPVKRRTAETHNGNQTDAPASPP